MQYYDHISKQKEEILRSIQDFFKEHIQYKFLDEDCEYSLSVQWCETGHWASLTMVRLYTAHSLCF